MQTRTGFEAAPVAWSVKGFILFGGRYQLIGGFEGFPPGQRLQLISPGGEELHTGLMNRVAMRREENHRKIFPEKRFPALQDLKLSSLDVNLDNRSRDQSWMAPPPVKSRN